ncbi:hypothetical protein D8674_024679 [Pyrus ussuriensis x Pyrus communis]|uniref:Uncharacterized protein n=1 Tax=Pyrus ussuriensis x Pyrus communis TaxID=2448454 RepID=A0A5N5H662_9ROSA|nr:hypothetical protein D8674_024679 [Pyrus ussuriensis x Pyrus communis]
MEMRIYENMDINQEQSMPFGPYDMRQYVEFAHAIGVAMQNNCPTAKWHSWKYVPENVKKAHHYELTNLDVNQNQYSDLHKHYEKYDGLEVILGVGCPIELVDCQDEWEWLCGHFQDEKYLLMKANSINSSKKKLLHRSGSRRLSYWLNEQRKFPEIDMFKEVYVQLGDELTEQFHSTMVEKGQIVLEEVASQLPPETSIEEVFPLEDVGFQIVMATLDRMHGNVPSLPSGHVCLIL